MNLEKNVSVQVFSNFRMTNVSILVHGALHHCLIGLKTVN